MIEDLIFKGKTEEEALAKAANFFGVEVDKLQYETLNTAESEQVSIQLTENPIRKPSPDNDEAESQRARYGLLRSDALPKSPPRQYQRPGMADVNVQQTDQKPRKSAQKPRRAEKPVRNNDEQRQFNKGGNDRRNYNPRNGRGPGRDRGRGSYQRDRQQAAPQHDPNWQPQPIDVDNLNDFDRKIYEYVTELLEHMNLQAQAQPERTDEKLLINIDGPDRNLLLNRKGEPLVAIQYLVNKIFLGYGDDDSDQVPVYVDSHRYRIARDEELYEIAVAKAEQVIQTGKEYSLNPMNPYERRQVHIALKEMEDVETVSRGSGYIKRISIIPAR